MDSHHADKLSKLKRRYSRSATSYLHFTALAEGVAGHLPHGSACPPGAALMAMKIWAPSAVECSAMVSAIAAQIGFTITGSAQIYRTQPAQSPRPAPFGYDIQFIPSKSETHPSSAAVPP